MDRWVEITFDCLPLRTVARLDIPIDASPKYREKCERLKAAFEKHGAFNTYYLYNAECRFHLTNHPQFGMMEYRFEGTVITDQTDLKTERADLHIELIRETVDWLTQPVVDWMEGSVVQAVKVEFDRYIEAGDLQKAIERINKLEAQTDQTGGFVGMYL